MIIPFIANLERLHAARDWMFRELLEICVPMRVHRPISLEVAADPFQKFRPAFVLRQLDRIMDAAESHALIHEIAQNFQMVLLNRRMPIAAIGINQNRVRPVERIGILRPAIGVNDAGNSSCLIETFLQQQTPGPMLVLPGTMAGSASDKDDLFISRRQRTTQQKQSSKSQAPNGKA